MSHPVLEKIDLYNPYFTRQLVRRCEGEDYECCLQIWLPVKLDSGGWVSAVHITGVDLPLISAMPGEDALDALLKALAFARDVVEQKSGQFLFGDTARRGAGLPISLDRGFPPSQLAEIETQAIAIRDQIAEAMYGELKLRQ